MRMPAYLYFCIVYHTCYNMLHVYRYAFVERNSNLYPLLGRGVRLRAAGHPDHELLEMCVCVYVHIYIYIYIYVFLSSWNE